MKATLLAFFLAVSSISAASVQMLDFPGESYAYQINDRGQVIGRWMNPQTGLLEGFLWHRGAWIGFGSSFSPAKINNAGIIVGSAPGGPAFYRNGSITLLPTGISVAALSDSGFITGIAFQTGKPYLYNIYTRHMENVVYDLPPPPDPIFPNVGGGTAVNDWGTIAGVFLLNDNNVHWPFTYRHGSVSLLPANLIWSVYFIGNNGAIAGSSFNNPFILNGSQFVAPQVQAPLVRGEFRWINCSGVAVGTGYTGPGGSHGLLYQNGVLTDLYSAYGLNSAEQINNRGQIVGYAFINGTFKAVLLNP